jgi:hypothetical protein
VLLALKVVEEEPSATEATNLARTATEMIEPDLTEQLKRATQVPASPAQILEALPSLAQAAQGLLLAVGDIAKSSDLKASLMDIRNQHSIVGRMLNRNVTALHDNLIAIAPFSGGDSYIGPRSIFQGLLNQEPTTPSENLYNRLSEIIFMANVATAAWKLMLLDAVTETADIISTLESIENGFPNHFLSFFHLGNGIPGSSTLLDLTFDFGLAVRTQLVAQSWRRECLEETFEPIDAIKLYFHIDDALKEWSFIMGRGEKYRNLLQARESQLRGLQKDGLVDFGTLETSFPWINLQDQALSWASARSAELSASLKSHGGSMALVSDLHRAKDNQAVEEPEQVQQVETKRVGRPRKVQKRAGTSGPAQPDKFMKGLMANPITMAQATASAQAIQNIDPELRGDTSIGRMPQRRLRVTDPQERAERVEANHYDDNTEILHSSAPQSEMPPTSSELNVTQDTGLPLAAESVMQYFSEHNHQELLSLREYNNRRASQFQPQPLLKRGREGGEDDEDDEDAEYNPAEHPMTSNYELVNAQAKQITIKVSKPIQTRTPWSKPQTDMLIWLIGEYGPAYSTIAKEAEEKYNDIFGNRGSNKQLLQGALKDKARNMKFDYMK